MTEIVKRRTNGQFQRGQSGNAAGARARRSKPLLTPADLDRIVLEIAAKETTVTINGVREQSTLYGAAVFQLGSGSPTNRLAAKDFIEVTNVSASRYRREAEREERRLADQERLRGY